MVSETLDKRFIENLEALFQEIEINPNNFEIIQIAVINFDSCSSCVEEATDFLIDRELTNFYLLIVTNDQIVRNKLENKFQNLEMNFKFLNQENINKRDLGFIEPYFFVYVRGKLRFESAVTLDKHDYILKYLESQL